jgi:hypothetical protein
MTGTRLIHTVLITLAFAITSMPQRIGEPAPVPDDENPKIATKIDEFGLAYDCEASARIDNLFIQLNNNPDATGYVITYAGTDFLPSQYRDHPTVRRMQRAMSFRRYDAVRVTFVDGGFRETQATEFWLVPSGAAAPEPTGTVEKPVIPLDRTFLWGRTWVSAENEELSLSEFILAEVQTKIDGENQLAEIEAMAETGAFPIETETEEAGSSNEEDASDENVEATEADTLSPEEVQDLRFSWVDEKFASEVESRRASRGTIIFYADELYYDVAKLQRFVEEGRDRIASQAKIQPDRIRVFFGGYRDAVEAEYWIVPEGGSDPEPGPAERPVEDPASQSP